MTRSKLKGICEKEIGVEEIDTYWQQNDYKVISPEQMTLIEMIQYIDHAEIVAAMSGTLPHNMLFAQAGSRLEIAERYVLNNVTQPDINNMRLLDVTYIDVNICLYPVAHNVGPYIYGCTNQLKKYSEDNGYVIPDVCFIFGNRAKKYMKRYLKQYYKHYHFQWYMENWYKGSIDYLWEAYLDSKLFFEDIQEGKDILFTWQLIDIQFLKMRLKCLIKRMIKMKGLKKDYID